MRLFTKFVSRNHKNTAVRYLPGPLKILQCCIFLAPQTTAVLHLPGPLIIVQCCIFLGLSKKLIRTIYKKNASDNLLR